MKNIALPFVAVALCLGPLALAQTDLEWAYQVAEEGAPSLGLDPDEVRTVPGSTRSYTQAEIDDHWTPPDWFPDSHPPMPEVVAHGNGPNVRACSACHLTSGMGHPESSQLAGLPAGYIVRQMADFKSGNRIDRYWMNSFAEHITDEDVQAAAEYFSSLDPIPNWVEVREAENNMVPRTFVADDRRRYVHPDGGMVPLNGRIVELPQDRELVTAGHPFSGFIAYVPEGSIARGKELATTGGNGKTVQCNICHGQDLGGLGDVPGIAGMDPLYVVRQLNDFKTGTRKGPSAALMLATVRNLTNEDIVALAAYVGSLDATARVD